MADLLKDKIKLLVEATDDIELLDFVCELLARSDADDIART